jgi:hypothetical protein
LVATALLLVAAACERFEPPLPQTPPLSQEAIALWSAIPESEKRQHGILPGGTRPFGVIVTDFRSAAVDPGFGYHMLIDEMRPEQVAKWEAMERLDFSSERDECGLPAAPVTDEVDRINAGDTMSLGRDTRLSRVNNQELVICPRMLDIACRPMMRRGRFVIRTHISRDRLCEWPALRQEIDAALKVWFPELEASDVQR